MDRGLLFETNQSKDPGLPGTMAKSRCKARDPTPEPSGGEVTFLRG